MRKINLTEKPSRFAAPWNPKIFAELAGRHLERQRRGWWFFYNQPCCCQAGVTSLNSASSHRLPIMKTKTFVLLAATAVLVAVPPAQAQSRFTELLRRVVTRAPLNVSTTVTRTTPAGPVTVTTTNTFSNGSGSFDTDISLPNGNTASVSGTINVTPGTGATVSGSITGPGGLTTSFTNTATPSAGGVTITSSVTPPNGNTVTRTNTLTPPDEPAENDGEHLFVALLKRLRLPVPPRD